jgi:hypothetical protein
MICYKCFPVLVHTLQDPERNKEREKGRKKEKNKTKK